MRWLLTAQLLILVASYAVDPRSLRPPLRYTDGFVHRSLAPVILCTVDPRSLRPPLNYTDGFAHRSLAPVTMSPIGYVSSPYRERFGTPRQATVKTQVAGGGEREGAIILASGMGFEHTLRGLAGFEYVWVISYMHLNTGWRQLIKPPRGPTTTRQGVFATRSPHRPNQMALSALRVVSVDEASLIISWRL